MDYTIFTKMRLKDDMKVFVLNQPAEYPPLSNHVVDTTKADFVHLFVKSQAELMTLFNQAASALITDGLFWVSYPKSAKKGEYDLNRDSLWETVIPLGFHPVSQVSLGGEWSAIRLRENVPGVEYVHPSKKKKE